MKEANFPERKPRKHSKTVNGPISASEQRQISTKLNSLHSFQDPFSPVKPPGLDPYCDTGSEISDDDFISREETAAEIAQRRSNARLVMLLTALCLTVFLSALDTTVVTTALPTIANEFHADQTGFTWIGSAYMLASAAMNTIWGRFSDIFGRKQMLVAANVFFMIGSAMCGASPNLLWLIIGRALQGMGGGGILVLVNIIIADLFSPRERGTYYGLLGCVWAVANSVGPLLGGIFSEKLSWRWCFYINLPLDMVALIVIFLFLDIHNPRTPVLSGLAAVDWLGSLAVISGTATILIGLEFGGVTFPWSSFPVVSLLLAGCVIWVFFFYIQLKIRPKLPCIPLHIYNTMPTISALGITAAQSMVSISGSYFLPVYFQNVVGVAPILSGSYLLPYVAGLSITTVSTGLIIRKTGQYHPIITAGMVFMTLGYLLFTDLPTYASWPRLILYQFIAGAGVGPNFQAPILATQAIVAPADIAAATSTIGFVRQLSAAISIVLGGVMFQNQMLGHTEEFVTAGIDVDVVEMLTKGGATGMPAHLEKILASEQITVVKDALVGSFSRMWIMYVAIGILGLGLTDWIGKRELSEKHEEAKTGLAMQMQMERQREMGLQRNRSDVNASGGAGAEQGQPLMFSDEEKLDLEGGVMERGDVELDRLQPMQRNGAGVGRGSAS
ncbi:MFS general substrate transporter [Aulographum hederae CBS 113979]|uniref:MFS general substrate transporter n=1 Tax=Aulographum hederae CBS 113979 TaxID=1176131 RepID=A0A6G1GZQ8_9PEZI|nr:MFS general substrate transporter [Aulographum hederae CBS 113979]